MRNLPFAAYHAFSAPAFHKHKNAINGSEPLNTALNAAELYFMTPPPQAVPLPLVPLGYFKGGMSEASEIGFRKPTVAINGLDTVKDFTVKLELYIDVCESFSAKDFAVYQPFSATAKKVRKDR